MKIKLFIGGLTIAALATIAPAGTPDSSDLKPAPAEVVSINNEQAKLGTRKAKNYSSGTLLKHLQTLAPGKGTTAPNALIPESLTVKENGRVLQPGKEYSADTVWGSIGVGTDGHNRQVTVNYKYKLLRIDSVIRTPEGKTILRQGTGHLTTPEPPPLHTGETRLRNIFINYYGFDDAAVFPVTEGPEKAPTQTSSGLVPAFTAKLKAGKPVKVVCWGDSVTAGGDASSKSQSYPAVFERMLKKAFPDAQINLKVVAVPGTSSAQWLTPEKYQHDGRTKRCKWQDVKDAAPDLVTVEFVNDAWLTQKQVEEQYTEILKRIRDLGAEPILITPNFTTMSMMGFKNKFSGPERRAYVKALKKFAKQNNAALADASARWEHLHKEGIPYITYLRNAINHPDDRGHLLYAEELMKCVK